MSDRRPRIDAVYDLGVYGGLIAVSENGNMQPVGQR
jgi:hypothetical protein